MSLGHLFDLLLLESRSAPTYERARRNSLAMQHSLLLLDEAWNYARLALGSLFGLLMQLPQTQPGCVQDLSLVNSPCSP
jgi:hypothetical protein